jgi:hypothetical protein
MIVKDLVSGDLLSYSFYISDVAAAKLTWATQGAAVSGSATKVQFAHPVRLVDLRMKAGPTVISGFYWQIGGVPIQQSNQLISMIDDSKNTPSFIAQGFSAGLDVEAIQF